MLSSLSCSNVQKNKKVLRVATGCKFARSHLLEAVSRKFQACRCTGQEVCRGNSNIKKKIQSKPGLHLPTKKQSLKVMYTNPRNVVAKAGMNIACLPKTRSAKAPQILKNISFSSNVVHQSYSLVSPDAGRLQTKTLQERSFQPSQSLLKIFQLC